MFPTLPISQQDGGGRLLKSECDVSTPPVQQIPEEGRFFSLGVEKILLCLMRPKPCLHPVPSQADARLDQDAQASLSITLMPQQPYHQADPDRGFSTGVT